MHNISKIQNYAKKFEKKGLKAKHTCIFSMCVSFPEKSETIDLVLLVTQIQFPDSRHNLFNILRTIIDLSRFVSRSVLSRRILFSHSGNTDYTIGMKFLYKQKLHRKHLNKAERFPFVEPQW